MQTSRRSMASVLSVALLLNASNVAAQAQPRTPPTATATATATPMAAALDLTTIERWLGRTCGFGREADVAWATAHLTLPLTARFRVNTGQSARNFRAERLTAAAEVIEAVCRGDAFGNAREAAPPGWLGRALADGGTFDTVGEQRRVRYPNNMVGTTSLLFTRAPDGEALLVGIRDE